LCGLVMEREGFRPLFAIGDSNFAPRSRGGGLCTFVKLRETPPDDLPISAGEALDAGADMGDFTLAGDAAFFRGLPGPRFTGDCAGDAAFFRGLPGPRLGISMRFSNLSAASPRQKSKVRGRLEKGSKVTVVTEENTNSVRFSG
jgi:hypothetical protein